MGIINKKETKFIPGYNMFYFLHNNLHCYQVPAIPYRGKKMNCSLCFFANIQVPSIPY